MSTVDCFTLLHIIFSSLSQTFGNLADTAALSSLPFPTSASEPHFSIVRPWLWMWLFLWLLWECSVYVLVLISPFCIRIDCLGLYWSLSPTYHFPLLSIFVVSELHFSPLLGGLHVRSAVGSILLAFGDY